MNTQTITIRGRSFTIPEYYQNVDPMPDDPEESVPCMTGTDNAVCFMIAYPAEMSKSLPRTKDDLIAGIRKYLGDNQGLIQVEAEEDHVFSIVKSLMEPGGVQYIFTYQKFYPDFILEINAFFEEAGIKGQRDSMVYGLCSKQGIVGSGEDPFKGWACDPYDESIRQGKLMNLSEHEKYDAMFPGHPLSMCRELIRVLTGNDERK